MYAHSFNIVRIFFYCILETQLWCLICTIRKELLEKVAMIKKLNSKYMYGLQAKFNEESD